MLNSEMLSIEDLECFKLARTGFDLRTIFSEVGVKLAIRAKLKNLYLDMHIAPETPRNFVGDPQAIKEIIYSLANSCLQSTKHGGVSIRIRSMGYRDLEQKLRLEIDISDTGTGLSPEALLALRDFKDRRRELLRQDESLIGLFTAKRLAKSMGGNLAVQSVFGWGTRFLVSIALLELSKMPVGRELKFLPPGVAGNLNEM